MGRLSPHILEECIEMARPILIEIARKKTTITYKQLMSRMGGRPGRGYIGEVVGEISEREYKNRKLKPSALVVREDTGGVGGGFLGLSGIPENIKRSMQEQWQNPRLSKADEAYWRDELGKVWRDY